MASEIENLRSEAKVVKAHNQELRAKVIRQDAAWKRKLDSVRRRGVNAAQPLALEAGDENAPPPPPDYRPGCRQLPL